VGGLARKIGFLTERQYKVLELRVKGYKQDEVARMLGTTRENIAMIEKKAR
jgi:Tfx family DNA-binding protein